MDADGRPQVLLIGQTDRGEMAPVCEQLEGARTIAAREIPAALTLLENAAAGPDLVVVCQSWPDEFLSHEVDALIAKAPVVRWVCCFGLWCEAIGRTHGAWPIAVCVPARNAAARIRAELEVIGGTRTALPVTASRDESFAFDFGVALPRTLVRRQVLVSSPDGALATWLGESLSAAGHSLVRSPGATNVDAVVWDADPWPARRSSLEEIRRTHTEATIVAVAGFAPPELISELTNGGVKRVVPKLDAARGLLSALDEGSSTRTV